MKERVEKLRKLLSDNGLDAALVTGLTAIRYYSGFTSDEAALVVTGAHASLLTDFRYTIQAKEQSPDFDVVEVGRGALLPTVDRLLKEDGAKRVAFENHTMTVATFEKYKALEYEFVPFSEEMNKPRLFKTADEIASLQKAQNRTTSTPSWGASAPPSTPSWAPAPTAPCATPSPGTVGSRRGIWWCWTSAASTTATTAT